MTATFINAFYEPFAHAKKKTVYTFVPPPPPPNAEYVANVQPAGVSIQVMWQLERDTSHVAAGLEYPRVGSLKYPRVGDWRWIPTRRPGKWVCHDQLANRFLLYCRYGGIVLLDKNLFKQSDRLTEHSVDL